MRRLAVIACAAAVCAAGASVGVGVGDGAAAPARATSHAAKRPSCAKAGRVAARRASRSRHGCRRPVWQMSGKRLRARSTTQAPGRPVATTPSAPLTTSPGSVTSTTPTTTTAAPPPPAVVASTLGVSAHDGSAGFYLLFSHSPVVPAGNLTVFFHNADVSDHNLWIEGSDGVARRISDTVGENLGGSSTVAVSAGSYVLFCSLPGHEAMRAMLTVTP